MHVKCEYPISRNILFHATMRPENRLAEVHSSVRGKLEAWVPAATLCLRGAGLWISLRCASLKNTSVTPRNIVDHSCCNASHLMVVQPLRWEVGSRLKMFCLFTEAEVDLVRCCPQCFSRNLITGTNVAFESFKLTFGRKIRGVLKTLWATFQHNKHTSRELSHKIYCLVSYNSREYSPTDKTILKIILTTF